MADSPRLIRGGDWGAEHCLIGPEETGFFSCARLDLKGAAAPRDTGFPQQFVALRA